MHILKAETIALADPQTLFNLIASFKNVYTLNNGVELNQFQLQVARNLITLAEGNCMPMLFSECCEVCTEIAECGCGTCVNEIEEIARMIFEIIPSKIILILQNLRNEWELQWDNIYEDVR